LDLKREERKAYREREREWRRVRTHKDKVPLEQ
jgi:hypothetical protein